MNNKNLAFFTKRNSTMEDLQQESQEPRPFADVIDILEVENQEVDAKPDPAEATINPNYNDNRRLFQRRMAEFSWNTELPYDK